MNKRCAICGKEFNGRANKTICSENSCRLARKRKYCAKSRTKNRNEYTKKCVICDGEFNTARKRMKYCGQICANKAHKQQMVLCNSRRVWIKVIKRCVICGCEFNPTTGENTCGYTCREKRKRSYDMQWVKQNSMRIADYKAEWYAEKKQSEQFFQAIAVAGAIAKEA